MFKKFTWKTVCVIVLVIAILINITLKLIQVSPFTTQLNSVITSDTFTQEEMDKITEEQKKNGIYLEKEKPKTETQKVEESVKVEEKKENENININNIPVINQETPVNQVETVEVKGLTNESTQTENAQIPVVAQ